MASTWSDDEKDLSISEIFQRAIDYWTPERIKNSVPFDEDSIDSSENNAEDPMESVLTCTEKLALGKKQREAQPPINTDLDLTHQNSVGSDSSDQAEELPPEINAEALPISTSSSVEMPLASQPRASLDQDSDGKTTTEAPPSTEGDQAAPATAKSEIPAAAKGKIPAASRSPRIDQKDLDLKTLPCQSVGKIHCATKSGEDVARDKYITAFYIGQPTQTPDGEPVERLLTVAHAFDERSFNTKHHIFVPASNADASNKDEMYLIHPRMKRVSPKAYCSGKTANDICVVFVIPNPLNSTIPISRTLLPLQLVVKIDYVTNDSWRVIGYPAKSHGMEISAYDGNYIHAHTISRYEPLTIQMDNVALTGMSGGPWILHNSDNRVNGMQSQLVKQPDVAASGRPRNLANKMHGILSQLLNKDNTHYNAASPFFRKELLEELDLHYQTI